METCRFRLLFRRLFIAYLSGDKQLLFAIEQGMTFTVIFISNIWPEMVRCRRKC
jgi:hypothetical protein